MAPTSSFDAMLAPDFDAAAFVVDPANKRRRTNDEPVESRLTRAEKVWQMAGSLTGSCARRKSSALETFSGPVATPAQAGATNVCARRKSNAVAAMVKKTMKDLVNAGVSASDVMGHPRVLAFSDRVQAAGLNLWDIFEAVDDESVQAAVMTRVDDSMIFQHDVAVAQPAHDMLRAPLMGQYDIPAAQPAHDLLARPMGQYDVPVAQTTHDMLLAPLMGQYDIHSSRSAFTRFDGTANWTDR